MSQYSELEVLIRIKQLLKSELDIVDYTNLDDNQIKEFNNCILSMDRSENENDFPDFINGDSFMELFLVSSSKETRKGSKYEIKHAEFERDFNRRIDDLAAVSKSGDIVEVFSYNDVNHKFLLDSIKNNCKNHFDKHINDIKKFKGLKICALYFRENSLIPIDSASENAKYIISEDTYALEEIQKYKDILDYFIFLNDSSLEIIAINNIKELIENNKNQKEYVFNENSGEINIGICDIVSDWEIESISFD